MAAVPIEVFEVLQTDRWFRDLAPALQRQILQACVTRRYAAGRLVYAAGDPPTGMFAVLSGQVRLLHHAQSGKYAFYGLVAPGAWFGGLSELDDGPRFSDAVAARDSVLLQLSHAAFQQLYRDNETAQQAFIRFICQNLRTTLAMLVEDHASTPRQHVAQILLSIFTRPAAPGDENRPRLTQEALAAMAGLSRQTVSKVLRQFSDQQMVARSYGSIEVLDLAALGEVARGQ